MRIYIRNKTDSNQRVTITPKTNSTIVAPMPAVNPTFGIGSSGEAYCCLSPRITDAVPLIAFVEETGGE